MIIVATGTRADWGLLRPLARELQLRGADIAVVATHAHLIEALGNTVSEIRADGFEPDACIPAYGTPSEAMAMATEGFGRYFAEKHPDRVVILGDRFEMLGVAAAALFNGVKIAHIAGGTVSEGAFDDNIRNAISMMADLHFPETDECAERLRNMGISPDRIFTAGALGLVGLKPSEPLKSLPPKKRPHIVATLHAETAPSDPGYSLAGATASMLAAFEPLIPDYDFILTYPNADVDPTDAIALLNDFAARYPDRVRAVPSLGHKGYLEAVESSCGVVGNSSSGLVEVPSLGVPTLDIGGRQRGRQHGPSVINCGPTTPEIAEGLQRILSTAMQSLAKERRNPYYRPDTLSIIAHTLISSFSSRSL